MMHPAKQRTEQEIVDSIIKRFLHTGKNFNDPKWQNELYWRYLAEYIPELSQPFYDGELKFDEVLASLPKIESITRTASDLRKELTEGKLTADRIGGFSVQKRHIYAVAIRDCPKLDVYADNAELVFRVWGKQDQRFADLLAVNSHFIVQVKGYAKPISITRLRRFDQADIKEEYGLA